MKILPLIALNTLHSVLLFGADMCQRAAKFLLALTQKVGDAVDKRLDDLERQPPCL